MDYLIILFLKVLLVIGVRIPYDNDRIIYAHVVNVPRVDTFIVPSIKTTKKLNVNKLYNSNLKDSTVNRIDNVSNRWSVKNIIGSTYEFLNKVIKSHTNASNIICIIASLAYIIPYIDITQLFGLTLLKVSLPDFIKNIIIKSLNIASIYSSIPFLSYVIFSIIYIIFVKKNQLNLHYFIRFNYLQSLIICSFEQVLSMLFLKLYPYSILDEGFIANVLFYTTILSSYGAILYSVILTLLGKYPLLPIISDAVKLHIGDPPNTSITI